MNQLSVEKIIEVGETEPSAEVLSGWLVAVGSHQDRQSFSRLFEFFAPRIKTYMQRLGADSALAEDLMQETMVKLWRKASTYDPARAVPSAWIFRIARNLRIDKIRRQKFYEVEYDQESSILPDERDSDPIGTSRMDAMHVKEHMKALPADQLAVIHLAYYEGLSHSEICTRLELPLGTVKSRLRLAFGKLREAMGAQS